MCVNWKSIPAMQNQRYNIVVIKEFLLVHIVLSYRPGSYSVKMLFIPGSQRKKWDIATYHALFFRFFRPCCAFSSKSVDSYELCGTWHILNSASWCIDKVSFQSRFSYSFIFCFALFWSILFSVLLDRWCDFLHSAGNYHQIGTDLNC